MSKPKPEKNPGAVSPTMSAAISIDLVQKQVVKNKARMRTLIDELNKLKSENGALELQRQELLREFDRTTR